jgi:hypothetical protein
VSTSPLSAGTNALLRLGATHERDDLVAVVADEFANATCKAFRSTARITRDAWLEAGTRNATSARCCRGVFNECHASSIVVTARDRAAVI